MKTKLQITEVSHIDIFDLRDYYLLGELYDSTEPLSKNLITDNDSFAEAYLAHNIYRITKQTPVGFE